MSPVIKRVVIISFFVVVFLTAGLVFVYFNQSSTDPKNPSVISKVIKTGDQIADLNPLNKNNKILVSSIQPAIDVKLNNRAYMEDLTTNLGFFSSSGYTIPNADKLPSSVSQSYIHDTINSIKFVFNYDDSPGSENIAIVNKDIKVFTSSGLNGDHSLTVYIRFYMSVRDAIKKGDITQDDLNKAVNLQILYFLSQISGKYTESQLTELSNSQSTQTDDMLSQGKLPFVINIK